jgi:predicted ATPase
MRLKNVFVRFYKSFNYDFLRKSSANPAETGKPWDYVNALFFPYVRIPVEHDITTVVGANESGKTHLLTAIEKGISGADIKREDFCRYSQFFEVIQDRIRLPDFGFEWTDLTSEDVGRIREACKLPPASSFSGFYFFRSNQLDLKIYFPSTDGHTEHAISEDAAKSLFPSTFRIDSGVALPGSVPIKHLADDTSATIDTFSRAQRMETLKTARELSNHPDAFNNAQTFSQLFANNPQFQSTIKTFNSSIAGLRTGVASATAEAKAKQLLLARKLICNVAKIDPQVLHELFEAIQNNSEGHANGIVNKINQALEARLNFAKVWAQDRDFHLQVAAREYDMVFTIRDRTGTEYSFDERSSGLKYFLSYYIQYLAHIHEGHETQILLMDEPDAYLSSQAQQDLLKVFEFFAHPEDDRRPVQVVYVTHSPFLIDKNHSERLRVLEKGSGDEGTRVVRDVARNHYEPLRSAFGAFVAETTFIGNCNLMVEGASDQVFLAGMSSLLRIRNTPEPQTLDLNRITIVPAGSASQIPYLVYLARGRDIEKPAIIVLLDGDEEGLRAKTRLLKGEFEKKRILDEKYVLLLSDIAKEDDIKLPSGAPAKELEDFVPISLAVASLQEYAKRLIQIEAAKADQLTASVCESELAQGTGLFDALQNMAKHIAGPDVHVDKVAYIRTLLDVLKATRSDNPDLVLLNKRFIFLFTRLRKLQRQAEKERSDIRLSHKLRRLFKGFQQDHPNGATKEEVSLMFESLEASLDLSEESEEIRSQMRKLSQQFSLNDSPLEKIQGFPSFMNALETLRHRGRLLTQETEDQV